MATDNKTRRLQVTLSEQTLEMINTLLKEGYADSRSAFLNEAARQDASRLKKAQLKRSLREGYKVRAERDRALAEEWDNASL